MTRSRPVRLAVKCLLAAVLVVSFAAAAGAVNLSEITANPDNSLWMSQEFTLEGTCTPTTSSTMYVDNITHMYSSPTFFDPGQNDASFVVNGNTRVLSYGKINPYLIAPGQYTFRVRCDHTQDSETASRTVSFSLKELIAEIDSATLPETTYSGTHIQPRLTVRQDPSGTLLSSDVSFSAEAKKDGGNWQSLPIHTPTPYYTDGSWVLNTTMPTEPGEYAVRLTATHDGGAARVVEDISVSDKQDLDISLAHTRVFPGTMNTLTVAARHRSDGVTVRRDDIDVELDGETIENITAVQTDPGESQFEFVMPDNDADEYEMSVEVQSDQVAGDRTFTIGYPISVQGRFEDVDESAYSFNLQLLDGNSVAAQLDGKGSYSGAVMPGEYDAVFEFDGATVELSDVDVDTWENPFQYTTYGLDTVAGMYLGGIYAFDTKLDFDSALVTMQYSTRRIDTTEDIQVFSCVDWNRAQGRCHSSWNPVSASFDEVSGEATVGTDRLDTYAIGVREPLAVSYSLDAETVLPDESVTVVGRITDQDKNSVSDATVTAAIPGSGAEQSVTTESDGSYSIALPAPDDAGDYTLEITAEAAPYRSTTEEAEFKVQRPAELSIVAPDSISIDANRSKTVSLYLENTGYRGLTDIRVDTDDIPLFSGVSLNSAPLPEGESREVSLKLAAPANASKATHTADVRVLTAEANASEVFGITVSPLPDSKTADDSTTTGMISSLPSIGMPSAAISGMVPSDIPALPIAAILLFQAGIVGYYYLRPSDHDVERDSVMRTMSHIKDEIHRDEN